MRNRTLQVALAGAVVALAALYLARKQRPLRAHYDYSGRTGFPKGAAGARGVAGDVAREAARWLSRPGSEVLPTSRVRAMTQPASPPAG